LALYNSVNPLSIFCIAFGAGYSLAQLYHLEIVGRNLEDFYNRITPETGDEIEALVRGRSVSIYLLHAVFIQYLFS